MSVPFDYSPQFTFTAATTDTLTATGHGLKLNDILQVYTTGGLPPPLALNTNYFVIASLLSANEFRISLTQGGAQVDITAVGTGVHSFAAPTNRPIVDTSNIPKPIIFNGRQGNSITMYKAPPPAAKLEKGYVFDTVTGTLESGGGGESWG